MIPVLRSQAEAGGPRFGGHPELHSHSPAKQDKPPKLSWASEMSLVKILDTKPGDLIVIAKTCVVDREDQLLRVEL